MGLTYFELFMIKITNRLKLILLEIALYVSAKRWNPTLHCLYPNILAHAVPLCLVSPEGPFGAVDTWLESDHSWIRDIGMVNTL